MRYRPIDNLFNEYTHKYLLPRDEYTLGIREKVTQHYENIQFELIRLSAAQSRERIDREIRKFQASYDKAAQQLAQIKIGNGQTEGQRRADRRLQAWAVSDANRLKHGIEHRHRDDAAANPEKPASKTGGESCNDNASEKRGMIDNKIKHEWSRCAH